MHLKIKPKETQSNHPSIHLKVNSLTYSTKLTPFLFLRSSGLQGGASIQTGMRQANRQDCYKWVILLHLYTFHMRSSFNAVCKMILKWTGRFLEHSGKVLVLQQLHRQVLEAARIENSLPPAGLKTPSEQCKMKNCCAGENREAPFKDTLVLVAPGQAVNWGPLFSEGRQGHLFPSTTSPEE